MSKKLRGSVSVRFGVIVPGMKTKYSVDPGLQDTVVPIANATISALAPRNTSVIYISHSNSQPAMLPPNLEYLEENRGARLIPTGLTRRLLPEDY
jgi:hypothetical protein